MKFCRLVVLLSASWSFSFVFVIAAFSSETTHHHHQCRKHMIMTETRLYAADSDDVGTVTSLSKQGNMALLMTDDEAGAVSESSASATLSGSISVAGGLPLLAVVATPLVALVVGRQTLAGRGALQRELNQKQFQLVKAKNDLANTETLASVSFGLSAISSAVVFGGGLVSNGNIFGSPSPSAISIMTNANVIGSSGSSNTLDGVTLLQAQLVDEAMASSILAISESVATFEDKKLVDTNVIVATKPFEKSSSSSTFADGKSVKEILLVDFLTQKQQRDTDAEKVEETVARFEENMVENEGPPIATIAPNKEDETDEVKVEEETARNTEIKEPEKQTRSTSTLVEFLTRIPESEKVNRMRNLEDISYPPATIIVTPNEEIAVTSDDAVSSNGKTDSSQLLLPFETENQVFGTDLATTSNENSVELLPLTVTVGVVGVVAFGILSEIVAADDDDIGGQAMTNQVTMAKNNKSSERKARAYPLVEAFYEPGTLTPEQLAALQKPTAMTQETSGYIAQSVEPKSPDEIRDAVDALKNPEKDIVHKKDLAYKESSRDGEKKLSDSTKAAQQLQKPNMTSGSYLDQLSRASSTMIGASGTGELTTKKGPSQGSYLDNLSKPTAYSAKWLKEMVAMVNPFDVVDADFLYQHDMKMGMIVYNRDGVVADNRPPLPILKWTVWT